MGGVFCEWPVRKIGGSLFKWSEGINEEEYCKWGSPKDLWWRKLSKGVVRQGLGSCFKKGSTDTSPRKEKLARRDFKEKWPRERRENYLTSKKKRVRPKVRKSFGGDSRRRAVFDWRVNVLTGNEKLKCRPEEKLKKRILEVVTKYGSLEYSLARGRKEESWLIIGRPRKIPYRAEKDGTF